MYEDEGTFCSTWDYCRIYKGVESRHTCANLGHRGKDACPLLFDRQSTFRFQSQVSRIQDGYFIARTIVAIVTHLQHPPRRTVSHSVSHILVPQIRSCCLYVASSVCGQLRWGHRYSAVVT